MSFEVNNSIYDGLSNEEIYKLLIKQLPIVFENETNVISNCSNFSSLLFNSLPNLNWVGFYFLTSNNLTSNNLTSNNLNIKNDLLLGPFSGKTACVRIALDRGVCGAAARQKKIIIVEDVHQFPGHIACDSNSNSEIVIPIIINDNLYGVLDIDSPIKNRFSEIDKTYLERLLHILTSHTEFDKLKLIY